MLSYLASYIGRFMHLGVVLLLVLCGLGLPVPEDLILVLAGATAAAAGRELLPMVGAAFVGVYLGDLLTFSIGRRWGQSIASTAPFAWMFTERRLRRARAYFRRYGDRTIFLARFVTGFRALVFLLAGSMGVPPRRFMGINLLGALITVPLEVSLGYLFASRLPGLIRLVRGVDLLAAAAVLLALALWLWRRWRRGQDRGVADGDGPPRPVSS